MKAAEIRTRFLEYFREKGHEVRPSSSLVPADDPTLLFTNAGMVQFKRVFLGLEEVPYDRAVTSQKCVRAGGKHNDLEEVGQTARHHTFFEMLGNFSFGDYFKKEAVAYAWEFLVDRLGLDPERLYVTVHHTDDEAAELWATEVGVSRDRIFRLGDKDNFWQMADTGPCGPCSELHYDMRPAEERGGTLDAETFERLGEEGRFLELWNLVFMQFDRDADGVDHPLPAPSIDTGAGLERIAAVLQGVDSNFHTDLFLPLLERAAEVVGRPYDPDGPEGLSYRVLADHARAVAFLLADGVFPSNDGRGYVLRRILRRAVRHAWLLGRREPTLVAVVESVIDTMSDVFPELETRREHVLRTTRGEEERFLATIEGGLERFEEIVGPQAGDTASDGEHVIPGDEAFRLYDTFGFPLDLTQVMARERGWGVDEPAFQAALEAQRERSRADRAANRSAVEGEEDLSDWTVVSDGEQEFVGYETTGSDTPVLAVRRDGDVLHLILARNPFYLESGGQVSDAGEVSGEGWRLTVEDVRRVEGRTAVSGPVEGTLPEAWDGLVVQARVLDRERHDTARNHTATHLLHAALRDRLGTHVVQRGSLVAPDRLRFDFAHDAPLTDEERARIEDDVNQGVWRDMPVVTREMDHAAAVEAGAMALFGEKYGDRVRVVEVPGVSMELCGGTHVGHTGEIGLFRIVGESGVAAGVRRIEALTGPGAFRHMAEVQSRLDEAARVLRTRPDHLTRRAEQLLEEKAQLEGLIQELRASGGAGEDVVADETVEVADGVSIPVKAVRLHARDADDARAWGDAFLEADGGVAVLAAHFPEGKTTLFSFVSDDVIGRGIRADAVVRAVAERVGGRGGGRPHMAQAGIPDGERSIEALEGVVEVVRDVARAGAS
ncbi:MAG TPA: alanine--tRNA ligase [Longimicrobiales bacterium]|nr:alanine--tRNA ligase [Longimicrobiales bacterium]